MAASRLKHALSDSSLNDGVSPSFMYKEISCKEVVKDEELKVQFRCTRILTRIKDQSNLEIVQGYY